MERIIIELDVNFFFLYLMFLNKGMIVLLKFYERVSWSLCNFGKERKWKEEPKDKKGKTSLSSICYAFKNEA